MSHDSDGDSAGGVPLPPSPPPSASSLLPALTKPKKPPLTHFLSLLLHHAPNLQASLDAFTHDISTQFPRLLIPDGAMRPAKCLHLTLGVMSLTSPELVEQAIQLLENTDTSALLRKVTSEQEAETKALRISLKGLTTMGPPKKTSVLYTLPHDATGRLLPFAGALRERFVAAGLMQDEKRELKLHATLLNTVYAKKGGRRSRERPMALDVQELVQSWGERIFVEDMEVNEVSMCILGAKDLNGVKGGAGYEEVWRKGICHSRP